ARALAISDVHGWIAVGHRVEHTHQLTLYRRDPLGKPTGNPIAIKTPRPAHLGPRRHYVPSLLFHPRLPLLYVWQAVEASKADRPPDVAPAWKDFDHLLVYSLDGANPELILSMARGPGFLVGVAAAALTLDAAAYQLFVPNVRHFKDNTYEGAGVGIL